MPAVLLIRHGQASFGGPDYDVLSDLGVRQVEALQRMLAAADVVPASLVAGSLRRQRDSAAPWTDSGARLVVDPRWDEYDSADVLRAYGDVQVSLEAPRDVAAAVTSRRFQEILDVALARWVAAGAQGAAQESWFAFRSRCVAALHELAGSLGSGETGLAFTSGGVIATCAAAILDVPDEAFITLNRTAINAGVTKVLVGRRGLSLVSYNEHGHLVAEQTTYR